MKLFSTSSDPVLLGSLLLAGYDVKYFPSSEKMPLDAHPEAVVLDGDLSDKEILTVEAKYLDLSVLLVRTDSALSQKGKVKILPQNTTATVLIQTLKNTEKGEEGTSIKKILIIEDNTAINEMYRTAFAQAGCKVETAFDGLEGITKAGAMKPDIILLDLMMPNMDGFEMLTALKRNTSLDTPVIVNTNLEGVDEERKAREMGADGFFRKSEQSPLVVVDKVLKGEY